ncbi:glycosyltransferase family 2 protein [uncultured Bacteroides sp.]|uniref:glycosyltransferase family 2 protein n=1 Tax=uncultured Bacteroides sp. TaxID=162156 RepID=UPI000821FDB4|nr:glycosyltransferase [uncultured Bacteroides sp.]SCH97492.1 Hyaluronan synthase [uncultured Bacteroides sp.]
MKVSVIVPVYNIADCVSNCVESLLCQDYKEMEIILVDDGSMDDSPMVCDDWAKKDARIKVVHKSNGGLSSARNAGMDAACGEYVLFIDGDDYLANGTIASFVNVAEKSQTDVVQFGYEEVYGYGKVAEGVETKEDEILKTEIISERHEFYSRLYALGGVAASGCTKFMRLDLARSLRFKEGILHEDEEFTTRLLAGCNSICYITEYTPYKYVMREGSIIHTTFKPKKLYDISSTQEERITVLESFGFEDLVSKAATHYFENLILLYLQAQKTNNKQACDFIDKKAQQLLSNYSLNMTGLMRAITIIYKLGLSGAGFYCSVRRFFGK